jgi:bacteriocin-like protein
MNDKNPGEENGLVRELTIDELEAVSGGGLWHWLKSHFHKNKNTLDWGGTAG